MPREGHSFKPPDVQTPEGKLWKRNEFPLPLGSFLGLVTGNSHLIITLPLKCKETRPGLESSGCTPGIEAPCGEMWPRRELSLPSACSVPDALFLFK